MSEETTLEQSILDTLDAIIKDERLGLKAPYLIFTPDAAKILAEALRMKMAFDQFPESLSLAPDDELIQE